MRKILVSQCLYGGEPVRFTGHDDIIVQDPRFNKWRDEGRLVPICPEVFGGLPTPRTGAQRSGDKVIDLNGKDVTKEYLKGVKEALRLAEENDVICCIMKEASPSCGSSLIYDEKRENIIVGQGITVENLRNAGFKVFSEYEMSDAEEFINKYETGKI